MVGDLTRHLWKTHYINLIGLRCVLLDGPSKGRPWRIHCHIGCICWAFHHSVFSNVSLNVWIESQVGCNDLIFLHCALSNVSSNRLHVRMKSHIGCNYLIFSTVRFHICLKIADMRGCKATLVALIWFSSSVCFQATPQKACPGKCLVILVAFVRFFKWFFSSLAWEHA